MLNLRRNNKLRNITISEIKIGKKGGGTFRGGSVPNDGTNTQIKSVHVWKRIGQFRRHEWTRENTTVPEMRYHSDSRPTTSPGGHYAFSSQEKSMEPRRHPWIG